MSHKVVFLLHPIYIFFSVVRRDGACVIRGDGACVIRRDGACPVSTYSNFTISVH